MLSELDKRPYNNIVILNSSSDNCSGKFFFKIQAVIMPRISNNNHWGKYCPCYNNMKEINEKLLINELLKL